MDELRDLIRVERRALVDELVGLSPEQWATPSLCAGWSVQEVAAHLAWAPALGPAAMVGEAARSGFRPNRFLHDSAVRWSGRGVPAILAQLQHDIGRDAKPMGMPTVAVLVDAVVHGLDIRRPLGRTRVLDPRAFMHTADYCAGASLLTSVLLGGPVRRRLAGLRLLATDQEWATGDGAEVRASGEVVLLVLAGRPVPSSELSGPGAATLVDRL